MAEIVGYFPGMLGVDIRTRVPLRNARGRVYDATDTEFTQPLPITGMTGIRFDGDVLQANSDGVFPDFKVPAGITQVIVKSEGALTPMTSVTVFVEEAQRARSEARTAANDAGAASTKASGFAEDAKRAADRAASAGGTTDAIAAGLMADEQSALHMETSRLIFDLSGSGLEIVVDPENPGMGLIVAAGSTPPPTQNVPPVILTTDLGPMTVGVAVDVQIVATGTPSSFFVSSGNLPVGLDLSTSGRLTGKPVTSGNYTFTVTATNAVEADVQMFTGSVVAAGTAPIIQGASGLSLTQGVPATARLSASGSGPITWSVYAGALPAGLELSPEGIISGTPTGNGPYSVTVQAKNQFGASVVKFEGSVAASTGPVNPAPGGSAGRVASKGPNGTHFPSRTPRPSDTAGWDSNVVVECSWPEIGQAIQVAQAKYPNGKCVIWVKRGTLGGNGAGSTSTPVLQNIGGTGRGTRILVAPLEGAFSIKHTASARLHAIAGVTFLGFTPWGLGVPEHEAFGVLLTNCKDTAWGWSKGRFFNLTSTAGSTDGVEFIECVAPLQGARDDDRMAFRLGDGGNIYNVFLDGCYIAGTYKAAGSDAHCDTIQLSGNGVFDGIHFRDTAVFGSTNATLITTGATRGSLENTVLLGGFRTALRYPVGSDRSQFKSGPVAFNGAPTEFTAKDSCLVGKVVPNFTSVVNSKIIAAGSAPPPVSGAWTIDDGMFDSKEKIDAEIPFPEDALLQWYWAFDMVTPPEPTPTPDPTPTPGTGTGTQKTWKTTVSDDFARPDGDLGTTPVGAKTWGAASATPPTIASGRVSATSTNQFASVPVGSDTFEVSAKIIAGDSTRAGVIIAVDAANFMFWGTPDNGSVRLYRVASGGGATQAGKTNSVVWAKGEVHKITARKLADAGKIELYIDDLLVETYTLISQEAAVNTARRAGVRLNGPSSTNGYIDDFVVNEYTA